MTLQKIQRNPDIETKILPDGHVVLFSAKNDWAQTVTPLAGIAWEFCDGSKSAEEIAQDVLATTNLESNIELKGQLISIIKEFEDNGLVFTVVKLN